MSTRNRTSSPTRTITQNMQRQMRYLVQEIPSGEVIILLNHPKVSLQFTFVNLSVLRMDEFYKINPPSSDTVLGKPDRLAICTLYSLLNKLKKDGTITPNTTIVTRINPLSPFDMSTEDTEREYQEYIELYQDLGFNTIETQEYILNDSGLDLNVTMSGNAKKILRKCRQYCVVLDRTLAPLGGGGGKRTRKMRR